MKLMKEMLCIQTFCIIIPFHLNGNMLLEKHKQNINIINDNEHLQQLFTFYFFGKETYRVTKVFKKPILRVACRTKWSVK